MRIHICKSRYCDVYRSNFIPLEVRLCCCLMSCRVCTRLVKCYLRDKVIKEAYGGTGNCKQREISRVHLCWFYLIYWQDTCLKSAAAPATFQFALESSHTRTHTHLSGILLLSYKPKPGSIWHSVSITHTIRANFHLHPSTALYFKQSWREDNTDMAAIREQKHADRWKKVVDKRKGWMEKRK